MVCHETLEDYYNTNFALNKRHGYSITELENMLPWERDIYIIMLINHLREEREKREQQSGG